MKKPFNRVVTFVLAMLMTALVFTQAMAANYPQIELDVHDSAVTIPEGEQGRINFTITAAYANERVQVRLYTETGKLIGIGSNSFYNAPVVQYTLTIDTVSHMEDAELVEITYDITVTN